MIKANEYRIGIWVQDAEPYNKLHQVDLNMLINAIGNNSQYRPIPLTPEWLESFGFKEGWLEFNQGCQFRIHSDGTVSIMGEDSATSGQSIEAPCRFVHQLQNLYFALTGEELQIKMP